MGWAIDPPGLRELLHRGARASTAPMPLMITENGAAFDDGLGADGGVHDPTGSPTCDGHLRGRARAIAAGVDLRGYFVWSLLDNFEWA